MKHRLVLMALSIGWMIISISAIAQGSENLERIEWEPADPFGDEDGYMSGPGSYNSHFKMALACYYEIKPRPLAVDPKRFYLCVV